MRIAFSSASMGLISVTGWVIRAQDAGVYKV